MAERGSASGIDISRLTHFVRSALRIIKQLLQMKCIILFHSLRVEIVAMIILCLYAPAAIAQSLLVKVVVGIDKTNYLREPKPSGKTTLG